MRLGARDVRDRGAGDGRGLVAVGVTDFPVPGNLLLNPSFEVDSNSDGLADSWTQYAGTTTIVPTVGGGQHGSKSQRITPALGDYGLIHQMVPCVAGLQYTLTTCYRIVALNGGDTEFKIEWYGADGTTLIGYDPVQDTTSQGTYMTNTLVRTAPANTHFAQPVYTGGGGCQVDLDFASFVQG